MCVLKQNEECPALGTSTCPRRCQRDSDDPTTQAGVFLQVLQALQAWDGSFCKLAVINFGIPHQQTLQSHTGRGQSVLWMKPPWGKGNTVKLCPGQRPDSSSDRNRVKQVSPGHRTWGGDAGGLNAWNCLGHVSCSPRKLWPGSQCLWISQ